MATDTDTVLKVTQGEFVLERLPKRSLELLRAWDAADEYLLSYMAEQIIDINARLLIINDGFGALAVGLNSYQPQAFSDSYLSQQATRLNLLANNIPLDHVNLTHSLEPLEGKYDWVLIKAPKTMGLLEDQLIRIHPYLKSSTQVIVAGMVKTMTPTIWKLVERLIGATTTSLAKKKARLIFATPNPEIQAPVSPYPVCYPLEDSEHIISNHANVFSRDGLDIGTRFFLQHIPITHGALDIVDLGCGNGLLGLIAAERNSEAIVHFVDESFMAVASAKDNFERALGLQRSATFKVGDGLQEFDLNSADIILCNPPFHQQNAIGDQIANSMIKAAKDVLRKSGELWIVGNRHLNYQLTLKRTFGNYQLVAENKKFVILKAKR